MREQAQPSGQVPQRSSCPRCKGVACLLAPAKTQAPVVVYGCTACGFTFGPDGAQYADNLKELKDFFRGATLGQKTLAEGLKGIELPPAARALLTAQIIEYGTTMWFDGLKQGLLLGALNEAHEEGAHGDGKVQPG